MILAEEKVSKFLHSFPAQLLFHQLRRNLVLVLIWVFFLVVIFGGVGSVYGIHLLFLDPEYLNKVNFLSFFWVGLALGNFLMAYQITSYILDGHRFPFLGVLERPFGKYVLNNSTIPGLALLIYTAAIIAFQLRNETVGLLDILHCIAGLYSGIVVMLLIMFYYFSMTNKDIFRFLAGSVDKTLRKSSLSRERMMSKYKESRKREYRVDYYFDLKLRFRSCKSLQDFYDRQAILKVFDQNHFNSVLFELVIIGVVFTLGIFVDNPMVQIPAAASVFLILSIAMLLIGAVSYWFRDWGVALVFGIFLLANFVSKTGVIENIHMARGLDYDTVRASYTLDNLRQISSDEHYEADRNQMLHGLTHWREKYDPAQKPKIVLLCVSGGGQRAALWTLTVLQQADSLLNQSLFDDVYMVTGASGGMIGAAYYRELYLNKKTKDPSIDLRDPQWSNNIGKDNLNALIFSLIVNDSFFKIRRVTYEDKVYNKDRGFVFEETLNRNLDYIFRKKLSDYATLESTAEIPLILMSPIVANDGRKLYLSASPVTFMTKTEPSLNGGEDNLKIRGVDFNRLFEAQGAQDLNFLTALRMSASFPYITPTMSLPSEPRIEVMDAGIADNFGIQDALRFMFSMREWIEENTSGVVMMIVRDTKKSGPIERQSPQSLIDRFAYPISSVYNNLANIQDINNDSQIESARRWLDVPIETVEFEYDTYTNLEDLIFVTEAQKMDRWELERASLSWHLTAREKRAIRENINYHGNKEALRDLADLLDNQPR